MLITFSKMAWLTSFLMYICSIKKLRKGGKMMKTLYERLQGIVETQDNVKNEAEVRDIWRDFLSLKNYHMEINKIDLSTKDTWFEFKYNRKEENIVNIAFAQLCRYVITAIKNGEELPKFLVVANRYLFVIVEMNKIIDNLKHNKMDWSFTPSKPSMEAIDFVEHKTSMYFRMFNVEKEEVYLREYYDNAIKNGVIIKTDITINNIQRSEERRVGK